MSEKKIAILKNAFFFLGALAVIVMVDQIGFRTIWGNLRQTGWWFLVIILIWGIIYLINSCSFYTVIQDGSEESRQVTFLKTYKLIVSGYALNYITPGGLLGGEPYRVLELKNELSTRKATSFVLLYAMMHFVSHFLFWMLSVPVFSIMASEVSDAVRIILGSIFFISLLLIFLSYRFYKNGAVRHFISLGGRLPFVGKRIRKYKEKNIKQILDLDFQISALYNERKKAFYFALFAEFLARFVSCLEIYVLIFSLGINNVSFLHCYIIVSFASLFANLLFFTPMQLGSREGGYALALNVLSIPSGVGVYVSLCTRVRELFWIAIGVGIMKLNRKRTK